LNGKITGQDRREFMELQYQVSSSGKVGRALYWDKSYRRGGGSSDKLKYQIETRDRCRVYELGLGMIDASITNFLVM